MHGVAAARKEFDPRSLAGCRAWYAADRGVGIESGKVAVWQNQVPGLNALQTNSSLRPTLSLVAEAKNKRSINFTGAEVLQMDVPISGAKTVVAILKAAGNPSSNTVREIWGLLDGESYSEFGQINFAGYLNQFTLHDQTRGTSGPATSNYSPLFNTTINCIINTFNGGNNQTMLNYTQRFNGVNSTSTSGSSFAPSASATGNIGARLIGGVQSSGFIGDFFEFILYGRVLSIAEQESILGYSRSKYGG